MSDPETVDPVIVVPLIEDPESTCEFAIVTTLRVESSTLEPVMVQPSTLESSQDVWVKTEFLWSHDAAIRDSILPMLMRRANETNSMTAGFIFDCFDSFL